MWRRRRGYRLLLLLHEGRNIRLPIWCVREMMAFVLSCFIASVLIC